MLLLLARSRPRPLTLIRPFTSMSALRSAILQGPAPGGTPLTMFSLTFGNVPSGFAGPAPFDTGMTPMPPSNLARKSRSWQNHAQTRPARPIPSATRSHRCLLDHHCTFSPSFRIVTAALRESQTLLTVYSPDRSSIPCGCTPARLPPRVLVDSPVLRRRPVSARCRGRCAAPAGRAPDRT